MGMMDMFNPFVGGGASEDKVARAEIAAIKDGEMLDSFSDVETALADKADITDIPTVPIIAIQKNGTDIVPVSGTVNITVPTTAADISALPASTKYAAALSLTINSSTFVMTGQLKDQNGDNLGTAQTIDLPLESVVVGGSYNSQTKKVVLTLQNGNTIEFSVADLVSGLQTELSASNKLNPAYINYDSTHRAVSDTEKSTWNSKQNALSSTQLSAVNSGITSADVEQITTNKNNISKQQDMTAQGGNGYAIINGQRLYMGAAQTPERTGDIWLDGATARESEYLLSANPLCGISTYKDTLNLATGACTRHIKRWVLDGSESWGESGTSINKFFVLNFQDTSTRTGLELCSHFVRTNIVGDNTTVGFNIINNGTQIRLRPENVSSTSLSDFTTWLTQQYTADNPVTVWYVIAIPTTETITVPSGNVGTVEGYLTQSGTPTPSTPIYPTANEVLGWTVSDHITVNGIPFYVSHTAPTGDIPDGSVGVGW